MKPPPVPTLQALHEASDTELRLLATATAQVFAASEIVPRLPAADIVSLSPVAAARATVADFQQCDPSITVDDIRIALEDGPTGREITCRILEEIGTHPELVAALTEQYQRLRRQLAAPELLLLSGALLVLAVKVKDIRLRRDERGDGTTREVVISFFQSGEVLKALLTTILRLARGA